MSTITMPINSNWSFGNEFTKLVIVHIKSFGNNHAIKAFVLVPFPEITEPETVAPVVVRDLLETWPVATVSILLSDQFDTTVVGYIRLSISSSSLQSSLSTWTPFSTHILSNEVSMRRGPWVFAFIKSFLYICHCVHSLYEPSKLLVSQKTRPSVATKENVLAKDCSHRSKNIILIQTIQTEAFFIKWN